MRILFPIYLFVGLLSTPFLSHASDESPFQEYAKIFDTYQRLCMLQKQVHAMREHPDTCDILWETYQPYLPESLYTTWRYGRTEEESKEEKLKHIDTFSRALEQEVQLAQHEMKTYCFDHKQYLGSA